MSHTGRKDDHLDLCLTDGVGFQEKGTLLDEVDLVHDALPDLCLDGIDLGADLCGKRLRAPVVIAAMTGGVERAVAVNRALASVAQELGLGFGFGSMRPLLDEGVVTGFEVRDVAPDALILGNIGVVQARSAPTRRIADMLRRAGCDALCVHLNPAMEVVQPGGDRDFRGCLDAIARLRRELDVPVMVKETGCGLSRGVGQRLVDAGIRWVDTSGAGGTSWVGVETLRAGQPTRALGTRFWDWGIPTAASVAQLSGLGLGIVATGGVRHGLDVARAIALGATAGGMARPFLRAVAEGGRDLALRVARQVVDEIRLAHLLTGSKDSGDLRARPVAIGPELLRWVPGQAPLRARIVGGGHGGG